jgi:cytochrome b561
MRDTVAGLRDARARERYDAVAIAFHWTVAALILFLGALGLLFGEIPRDARPFWINVHASVGLVYFVLVIARLFWRMTHQAPDPPADMGELTRLASLTAHRLLYVLMLAIPALGAVAYVWHGRVFDYGLFELNFGVASNRAVYRPAEEIHQLLAYGLFAVAALHASGALWHHHVRRDQVLMRMLGG